LNHLLHVNHALTHQPPSSPSVPYTTLFRSRSLRQQWRRSSCRLWTTRDRSSRALMRAISGHSSADAISSHKIERDCSCRGWSTRSEEHTSELQSLTKLVCRLLILKHKIASR